MGNSTEVEVKITVADAQDSICVERYELAEAGGSTENAIIKTAERAVAAIRKALPDGD